MSKKIVILVLGILVVSSSFSAAKSTTTRRNNTNNKTSVNAPALTDYETVQQLIIGERLYRATQRNTEHANTFWEDATIMTSWQSGGVSSFVGQRPNDSAGEQPIVVGRNAAPLIHLRENKAFVEYPTTTIRTVKVNDKDAILTSHMRLLYRVEKRNNVWKISKLVTVNELDGLQPVIAGQDLGINPKDVEKLRVSYRWLAYVRENSGNPERDDLYGIDRPEELQKLYDEEFSWLEK